MNRKNFFRNIGLAAAGAVVLPYAANAQNFTKEINADKNSLGKRKLGRLEVSGIRIGVQNMSRTYQTTIPTRTEMHRIIRNAYDNGVTFFDAAEAYGPHEVERILGEATVGFRDNIVIATKFGWNIDQENGKRQPGLNSKPGHVRKVVDGMLQRMKTDRIDLLYQHCGDPEVPIEEIADLIKDLKKEGKVCIMDFANQALKRLKERIKYIRLQQYKTSILYYGEALKRKLSPFANSWESDLFPGALWELAFLPEV